MPLSGWVIRIRNEPKMISQCCVTSWGSSSTCCFTLGWVSAVEQWQYMPIKLSHTLCHSFALTLWPGGKRRREYVECSDVKRQPVKRRAIQFNSPISKSIQIHCGKHQNCIKWKPWEWVFLWQENAWYNNKHELLNINMYIAECACEVMRRGNWN